MIKSLIKIEKLIDKNIYLVNPQAFDSIDALSGVISFLISDVCDFYGLVPPGSLGKLNLEKRVTYNIKKKQYYSQKLVNSENELVNLKKK